MIISQKREKILVVVALTHDESHTDSNFTFCLLISSVNGWLSAIMAKLHTAEWNIYRMIWRDFYYNFKYTKIDYSVWTW